MGDILNKILQAAIILFALLALLSMMADKSNFKTGDTVISIKKVEV